MATPKLIFGAGALNKDNGFHSAEDVKPWLEALLESKAQGLVDKIDTAAAYRESQDYLAELDFVSHFSIDSKVTGGANPEQPATGDVVMAEAKENLRKLGMDKLDTLFIHASESRVPLEDTLSGINTLYKEGKIERFGLSNYNVQEVKDVIKVCNEQGFVLPSVFEGSYSAVSRLPEQELLPLLRKHKIAFYAYSPISGGFLAKTSQQFRDKSLQGRWDASGFLGSVYHHIYNKPDFLDALDQWHAIAAAEGIPSVEMAYRWVVHHSALDGSLGDAIIVGASSVDQWKSNLAAIQKGPLSENAAAKIDALWNPSLNPVLDVWEAIKEVMAAQQPAAGK